MGRLWTPADLQPFVWIDGNDANYVANTSVPNRAPWVNYPATTQSQFTCNSAYVGQVTEGSKKVLSFGGYGQITSNSNWGYAGFGRYIDGLSVFAVANIQHYDQSTPRIFYSVAGTTVYQDMRLTAASTTDSTKTTVLTVGGRRLSGNTYQSHTANRLASGILPYAVWAGIWDYRNAALYAGVNGVYTARSGGFQTTGNTDSGATGNIRIGNTATDQVSLYRLAELVVVYGVLSEANRQALEGYLAHRWGAASLLPSGHPYLVGPPYILGSGVIVPFSAATISGNATRLGGGAVRVLAVDGPSGELIYEAAPDGDGDWTADVFYGRAHYLTYLGDSCAPITHGPYTVVA